MLLRSLETYLASHYAFRWRQAMTETYLPRWQKTSETVEGASQRIQEDCMRFARQTENLGLGLVRAVLTLASFIPILWALSKGMAIAWLQFEGSLFWVALFTALGGTVLSWFVGIHLPGLEYNNQKTEAALRKDLVYAEDDRSRMDLPTVLNLFTGVRLNNFRLFNHYAYFNLWSNFYSQSTVIFPYLLMGPSLFTGLITLGVIQQVSNAFGKVNEAFSYLIERWTDITELRSIHKRLTEFEKGLA
jgi:peptide/bleomycin uptake transporter